LLQISQQSKKEYRQKTFRLTAGDHLKSAQQAIDFVNFRGFILFWPDPKMELPNLWQAVAGERPVPDEHDDPAHITWDWKDSLLDKKVWYYARVIRQRNTMISLDLLPYFYALSPNYGSPIDDIQDQYLQGDLPLEAKHIFETLLSKGPLDTITLRKEAHLSSTSATQAFQRSLNLLQRDFKLLPVAIADVGTWHYAFRYELTHRYFPDLVEKAHDISEIHARTTLAKSYIDSVGAATPKQVSMVFGWPLELTNNHLFTHSQDNWIPCEIESPDGITQGYCSFAVK
jgi:hypothetical protein